MEGCVLRSSLRTWPCGSTVLIGPSGLEMLARGTRLGAARVAGWSWQSRSRAGAGGFGGLRFPPFRLENEAQRSAGTAGLGCQFPEAPSRGHPSSAPLWPWPRPRPFLGGSGGWREISGGWGCTHAPSDPETWGTKSPGDSAVLGSTPGHHPRVNPSGGHFPPLTAHPRTRSREELREQRGVGTV